MLRWCQISCSSELECTCRNFDRGRISNAAFLGFYRAVFSAFYHHFSKRKAYRWLTIFINLINDRYARLNIHSPERQEHFRVINVNSSSRLLNLAILAKGSAALWNVYSNTICNDLVYAYRLNARAFCATFCVPERQAVPLRWIRTTVLESFFKITCSTAGLNF